MQENIIQDIPTKTKKPAETENQPAKPTLSSRISIKRIALLVGAGMILIILSIYIINNSTPDQIEVYNTPAVEISPTTATDNVEVNYTLPVEVSPTPTEEPYIPSPVILTSVNMADYDLILWTNDGYYVYNIAQNNKVKFLNETENLYRSLYLSGSTNPNELIISSQWVNGVNNSVFKVNLQTKSGSNILNFTEPKYGAAGIENVFDSNNLLLSDHVMTQDLDYNKSYSVFSIINNKKTSIGVSGNLAQRGASYPWDGERVIPSPDSYWMILQPMILKLDSNSRNSNTYIVNQNAIAILTIPNSTMPLWMDDTNILYVSTLDNRLYIFNLDSNSSSQLSTAPINMNGKYGMSLNGSKILYWTSDRKIYMYDLISNTETKLLDNATEGRWYDSNRILFSKVYECDNCLSGLDSDNLWVYYVDTATIREINNSSFYLSKTDRGYYYCESISCMD